MDIRKISVVKIPTDNAYKYLVAEICDKSGNKKIVVRAGVGGQNHKEIAEAIKEEMEQSVKTKFLGGGTLM